MFNLDAILSNDKSVNVFSSTDGYSFTYRCRIPLQRVSYGDRCIYMYSEDYLIINAYSSNYTKVYKVLMTDLLSSLETGIDVNSEILSTHIESLIIFTQGGSWIGINSSSKEVLIYNNKGSLITKFSSTHPLVYRQNYRSIVGDGENLIAIITEKDEKSSRILFVSHDNGLSFDRYESTHSNTSDITNIQSLSLFKNRYILFPVDGSSSTSAYYMRVKYLDTYNPNLGVREVINGEIRTVSYRGCITISANEDEAIVTESRTYPNEPPYPYTSDTIDICTTTYWIEESDSSTGELTLMKGNSDYDYQTITTPVKVRGQYFPYRYYSQLIDKKLYFLGDTTAIPDNITRTGGLYVKGTSIISDNITPALSDDKVTLDETEYCTEPYIIKLRKEHIL